MDTFYKTLKQIYEWYFTSLDDYNNFDFSKLNQDDLFEIDTNNDEALSKTIDEIMYLGDSDYEEFSNLISILSLHYYNLLYDDSAYNIKNDQLIDDMISNSKEDFIRKIYEQENDYLIDMLSISLDDNNIMINGNYDYGIVDYVLSNQYNKILYLKFHPNISIEMENIKKYRNEEKFFDRLENVKLTSLLQFLQIVMYGNYNIDDKPMLSHILLFKLNALKLTNNNLYNEIYSYGISNFYLTVSNQEHISDIDKILLENIENGNLNEEELDMYGYRIIDNFVYYDIMKYSSLLNESSKKDKELIKRLIEKE